VVDSGIADLGSNPKHLKDFGRCPFRARAARGAGKAKRGLQLLAKARGKLDAA